MKKNYPQNSKLKIFSLTIHFRNLAIKPSLCVCGSEPGGRGGDFSYSLKKLLVHNNSHQLQTKLYYAWKMRALILLLVSKYFGLVQTFCGWPKINKKNPHSGSRLGLPLTPQPTRLHWGRRGAFRILILLVLSVSCQSNIDKQASDFGSFLVI